MPNGGMTEAEFRELEDFFRPIAGCLEEFAEQHNLLLERYYHDFAAWSLRFAHPAGGSATVDVARSANGSVSISGTWWLDVYREFTRYLKDTDKISRPIRPDAVLAAVRSTLAEVLDWQPGSWSRVAGGYQDVWSKFTESEFNRMSAAFPIPRQPS